MNSSGTPDANASNRPSQTADIRAVTVVSRICTPRRSAIAAPSIASHRNSSEATSSLQTNGRSNTKREMTPNNRTITSATTRMAAGISVAQRRVASARPKMRWVRTIGTVSTARVMPGCLPSVMPWSRCAAHPPIRSRLGARLAQLYMPGRRWRA